MSLEGVALVATCIYVALVAWVLGWLYGYRAGWEEAKTLPGNDPSVVPPCDPEKP